MAYNPNIPAPDNLVQDDIAAMRENFQHLDPLAQAVDELQTVSGLASIAGELQTVSGLAPITGELQTISELAPYVQVLLDSRIVEMGSNANGEYVRFENGLQVCYRFYFELPRFTGSVGETMVGTWTYPATFVSMPTVFLTNRRSSDDYRGSEFTVSTWYPTETDTMILARNNTGTTFSPACGCGAIGRWK